MIYMSGFMKRCASKNKRHMIQIHGIKRQVYVKLTDKDYMLSIINGTGERGKYNTGEISRENNGSRDGTKKYE
jgi:hypothetical protein